MLFIHLNLLTCSVWSLRKFSQKAAFKAHLCDCMNLFSSQMSLQKGFNGNVYKTTLFPINHFSDAD